LRLYKAHFGELTLASREDFRTALKAPGRRPHSSRPFSADRCEQVVDAHNSVVEAYRGRGAPGRKTRLPEAQRQVLWSIFDKARAELAARPVTGADVHHLAAAIAKAGSPFDFTVIDEAQDLPCAVFSRQRWAAAARCPVLRRRPGAAHFQLPLVEALGRYPWPLAHAQVNHRNSHHRTQADRLLAPVVSDVDGNDSRGHGVGVQRAAAGRAGGEGQAAEGRAVAA
jgi:hypothetical protein